MTHLSRWLPLLSLVWTSGVMAEVDYIRDVKPLLAHKCAGCHGPVRQEGGLRLDAAALVRQGGESGMVVVPGRPDEGELLARVTSRDDDYRMPPPGEGEVLTAEQLAILRQWI